VCLLFIRIYRNYVGHTRALSCNESVEESIRESASVEVCVLFVSGIIGVMWYTLAHSLI